MSHLGDEFRRLSCRKKMEKERKVGKLVKIRERREKYAGKWENEKRGNEKSTWK